MLTILCVYSFISKLFCPDLSKILNISQTVGNRQLEQSCALTFRIEQGFMKLKSNGDLWMLLRNYTIKLYLSFKEVSVSLMDCLLFFHCT